jgi:hypothetical protein
MVTVAVSIIVLGTSFTALVDRQTSGQQQRANASYYLAQAGLSQYKTLVFRNLIDAFEEEQVGWCESPLGGGIEGENGETILENGASTGPITFGEGTYEVTFQELSGYIVLTSVGRVGTGQTTLQLVTTAGGGPGGAWDNAILASGSTGAGQNNGNVTVYGSIHIVGDYEAYDPDISVSGTVGVFNDYVGTNNANSNITSALAPIIGNTNVDLCARVKIKSGSLYIQGGSVELGTDDRPIYSIHMRDGQVYGKKKPAGAGDILADHHTTNRIALKYPEGAGMLSPYDAYDIPFPSLDANFPNDVEGALDLSTCAEVASELVDGVLNLPPASPFACSSGANVFAWNASGFLEISGDVNIGGVDVLVGAPITYQGKGRMRQGANRDDTSRTFTSGYSIRPQNGVYPSVNALALETSGSVLFNPTASGQVIAMMAYAQQVANFEKQVILVGSIVANEFSVGNQVPNIAYHPDVRTVAEELCLTGSFCAGGVTGTNPGILTDISIERRDVAAID